MEGYILHGKDAVFVGFCSHLSHICGIHHYWVPFSLLSQATQTRAGNITHRAEHPKLRCSWNANMVVLDFPATTAPSWVEAATNFFSSEVNTGWNVTAMPAAGPDFYREMIWGSLWLWKVDATFLTQTFMQNVSKWHFVKKVQLFWSTAKDSGCPNPAVSPSFCTHVIPATHLHTCLHTGRNTKRS